MTVEPMTDAGLTRWEAWLAENELGPATVPTTLLSAAIARARSEKTRADAAEAERDAAVAREAEREADADGWFLRAAAAIGKLPSETLTGDLQAALREIETRLIPKPRLMRTVGEVEALADGWYRAFFPEDAPWAGWISIEAVRPKPSYFSRLWECRSQRRTDAEMVGAWISGPLPDLPTPTGRPE